MYYVYKIKVLDHVYIGCTSDIVRRKNQHNENARKRKSKFGRFLNDNGIVLTVDNFEILFEFKDRPSALKTERKTTKECEKNGEIVLNELYSKSYSKVGKNLGNTAKEYVVVDYVEHTAERIFDLRQYCAKRGLDHRLLNRTQHGNATAYNKYKVFFPEDWKKIDDKERYLCGRFVKETRDAQGIKIADRQAKKYEVMFPDGHVETVLNLDKFARDNGINSGNLHASFSNGRKANGYKVIRRI